MPIDNGDQVHETLGHRAVCNISRPDLVGPLDAQVPQQVRINFVPLARLTRSPPRIQCRQVHLPHQSLNTLSVDRVAAIFQFVAQAPAAVKRVLQVDLIDESHQRQVLRRDQLGLVVRARAGHIEQLATPCLGQFMNNVNLGPALVHRSRPSTLDKKSFSIAS